MGKFIKEDMTKKAFWKSLVGKIVQRAGTKAGKETLKTIATGTAVVAAPAVATKVLAPEPVEVKNEDEAKAIQETQISSTGETVIPDPFVDAVVPKDSTNTTKKDDPIKTTIIDPKPETKKDTQNIVPVKPKPTSFQIDTTDQEWKNYMKEMELLEHNKKLKKQGSYWPNSLYKLAQVSDQMQIDRVSPIWEHKPGSKRYNEVLESMKLDPKSGMYSSVLADTVSYRPGPNMTGKDITHFAIPKDKSTPTKIQNKWSENIDGAVDPKVLKEYLDEHVNQHKRPITTDKVDSKMKEKK